MSDFSSPRKIAQRRKNEPHISRSGYFEVGKASGDECDSVCGRGASFPSSREGSLQREDDEFEESDEEIEEVKEE